MQKHFKTIHGAILAAMAGSWIMLVITPGLWWLAPLFCFAMARGSFEKYQIKLHHYMNSTNERL